MRNKAIKMQTRQCGGESNSVTRWLNFFFIKYERWNMTDDKCDTAFWHTECRITAKRIIRTVLYIVIAMSVIYKHISSNTLCIQGTLYNIHRHTKFSQTYLQ